jgi:hypothetical protein
MQYLLIICHDDAFRPSATLVRDIRAWIAEATRRKIRVCGNPLRPARDAVTVRVRQGRPCVRPGPFARSREKMCAYELVDCGTREEAIDLASRHPMAKVATIEVRPVWTELAGQ